MLAAKSQTSLVFHSFNHIFPCAGRFLITFSRDEKVMIEQLDENTSEQSRLMTAIEYKGKRSPQ